MRLLRAVEWMFMPAWRLVAVVALVALPLLVVSELSSRDQREQLRASEERTAVGAAERAAATFGDHVLRVRNSLAILTFNGRILAVFKLDDRSEVTFLLGAARQAIGDEARVVYALDERHLIYSAVFDVPARGATTEHLEAERVRELIGTPFPHPEMLVKAPISVSESGARVRTNAADSRIGDPYIVSDGHVIATVSAAQYPFLILAAEVDLTRVSERIAVTLPVGDIYLTDRNGALLLSLSRSDRIPQLRAGTRITEMSASDRASRAVIAPDPIDGRPMLTAVAFVPETDWRMVVIRPSTLETEIDPVLAQVRAVRALLAVVLLFGAAVIAVTGSRVLGQRRALAEVNSALASASQEKSRFLANMSHELRTPLNAIIGFAQLLEEGITGPLSPKQSEYLHDISESGKHQLALINDILDLSKVEAGKMEFRPEPFDANDAVRRVQTLVAPLAQSKGVHMRVEGDAPLPIEHDPARFRQILYNLLSNAVKFTPEGGSVTTAVRSDGDGWVELAVTDTGVGMSADDLASIFQEFKRVGSTYAQAQLGTGLGLALVRRFVEGMGGTITVASTEGQGSTFTVRLPKAMPATATV